MNKSYRNSKRVHPNQAKDQKDTKQMIATKKAKILGDHMVVAGAGLARSGTEDVVTHLRAFTSSHLF